MPINKILVVDDSQVDLTSLQQIISDAGYTVVTASDGFEAVEAWSHFYGCDNA